MVEWVKEHPYLTGATVLGLFVLIMIFRRGSSSAPAASGAYGPSEGLQATALQTGASLQGYAYQAQAGMFGMQTEENIARINRDGSIAQSYIDSIVSRDAIAASLKLGLTQTAGVLALNDATGQVTEVPGGGLIFGATDASAIRRLSMQNMAPAVAAAVASTPAALEQIFAPVAPAAPPAPVWSQTPSGSYIVGSGGPGADVHGVDTQLCDMSTVGGQYACSVQNQSAIVASYGAHPGSYLGNGVYAGTPEAWKVYGDPSMSYEQAHAMGRI